MGEDESFDLIDEIPDQIDDSGAKDFIAPTIKRKPSIQKTQ